MSEFKDMLWGFKFVAVDLTTDDHQGGRFRYRLGEWREADPGGRSFSDGECPSFPGDGLCVARTLSGAQSGGQGFGLSTMLLVGYRSEDVLGSSRDKVRVRRLFVAADPIDPVRAAIGPHADLRYANLGNADLRNANLRYADLRYADLVNADLRNANLRYADLRYANLGNANLRYANLRNARLRYANLRYANLRYANLRYANLGNADLRGADRPSWLPSGWLVTSGGLVTEA